jgi:hypothetical protein
MERLPSPETRMTAIPPVPYAVDMAQIGSIAKSGAKLQKKKHIYKKKFAYIIKKQ